MTNEEITEIILFLDDNCVLGMESLIAEFSKHMVKAGLRRSDVATLCHWVYLDIKEKGENSFWHKNKERPLPINSYICEHINMFLIARDQFHLMD